MVARHRQRGGERKEKGKVYADCQRNARESEIREGDKVLVTEAGEREKTVNATQTVSLYSYSKEWQWCSC